MKIGLAQLNPTVGDLSGNVAKILAHYQQAIPLGADVVLTPELSIPGYPPQDLVFKSRFVPANLEALAQLHAAVVPGTALVVGFVERNPGAGAPFFNSAAFLAHGREPVVIRKSLLPTYDVFDEARYFEPATTADNAATLVEIAGRRAGITICEDIWTEKYLPRRLYEADPVGRLVKAGAELILNISASPFQVGKPRVRSEMLAGLAAHHGVPFAYCNTVGGNDELIFDGNSLAFDGSGRAITRAPGFAEYLDIFDLEAATIAELPPFLDEPAELHAALVLGLRDYLGKCGFKSAVLGLSGGIDSAVVACLAADALGPQNVLGVAMPSPYSSPGSVIDALALAKNLGIRCEQIPIAAQFDAVKASLRGVFAGLPEDTTEENIQARLRGITLMALSNKFGHLLLTTGNKSELAVGYCTLYGDMAGGLAVISDVPKTAVYRLARWLNRKGERIPFSSIEKPPSAELKPGQVDQDSLPPYDVLDRVLQLYVEENLSGAEIIAQGVADEKTVRWIIRRVDLNEYKRAQAVPGLKVTSRAFGVGRRMPVAQRFVE